MQELLSENAASLLKTAQTNAVLQHEEAIGCDALLLSLLQLDDCTAIRILRQLGVDLEALRQHVEQETIPGGESTLLEPGLLPRAQRVVFDSALRSCRARKAGSIGTEDILLGLLYEEDIVPGIALNKFGVTVKNVQRAIMALDTAKTRETLLVPTA